MAGKSKFAVIIHPTQTYVKQATINVNELSHRLFHRAGLQGSEQSSKLFIGLVRTRIGLLTVFLRDQPAKGPLIRDHGELGPFHVVAVAFFLNVNNIAVFRETLSQSPYYPGLRVSGSVNRPLFIKRHKKSFCTRIRFRKFMVFLTHPFQQRRDTWHVWKSADFLKRKAGNNKIE